MPTSQIIHEPLPAAPVTEQRVDEPFTLVIFGARGNLAGTKLLPAIFALWRRGFFAKDWLIVGIGRPERSDTQFRDELWKHVDANPKPASADEWARFAASLFYQRADVNQPDGFRALAERLRTLEKQRGMPGNRLFYLATDPDFFGKIVEGLAGANMLNGDATPWSRVVIEKPFGKDLASARALDDDI